MIDIQFIIVTPQTFIAYAFHFKDFRFICCFVRLH